MCKQSTRHFFLHPVAGHMSDVGCEDDDDDEDEDDDDAPALASVAPYGISPFELPISAAAAFASAAAVAASAAAVSAKVAEY